MSVQSVFSWGFGALAIEGEKREDFTQTAAAEAFRVVFYLRLCRQPFLLKCFLVRSSSCFLFSAEFELLGGGGVLWHPRFSGAIRVAVDKITFTSICCRSIFHSLLVLCVFVLVHVFGEV